DLSFDFTDTGSEIAGVFNYDSSLFEASTVAQIAQLFVALTEQVLASPDVPLAQLSLPVHSESQGKGIDFSHDNVLSLFQSSVERHGNAIAVTDGDNSLGYEALDARATALAGQLQAHGVSHGDCVGILAERSCDFVVGVLAVLKSGGMYLPLDSKQPAQRIQFQLIDSAAKVVLTTA
ncbi:AMP-binding protein, partial [Alteromonas sp. 5E99-2]|uniref:AMP-binding protein n=1 Tax=Alteromonas sp. 5E99-2 TaxID=2817683 RepID=UPI001A99E705